jgi:hypothetical protein
MTAAQRKDWRELQRLKEERRAKRQTARREEHHHLCRWCEHGIGRDARDFQQGRR